MINAIIYDLNYRRFYSVILYIGLLLPFITFVPYILGEGFENIFNISLLIFVLLLVSSFIIVFRLGQQKPAFSRLGIFANLKKFTQEELKIYVNAKEITLRTIIVIGFIGFLSIAVLVNNTSNNWPLQEPISIEQEIQQNTDISYYLGICFFTTLIFLIITFITAIILPYSILLWNKNFLIFLREGKYKDLKAGKVQLEE